MAKLAKIAVLSCEGCPQVFESVLCFEPKRYTCTKLDKRVDPDEIDKDCPLPEFERAVTYRLLKRGEKIQRDDQVMGDDTVTWGPLCGWEVGIEYDPSVYVPMRRKA